MMQIVSITYGLQLTHADNRTETVTMTGVLNSDEDESAAYASLKEAVELSLGVHLSQLEQPSD